MKNTFKRSIGDILSLIVGSNDEDYEPTKEHYTYFFVTLGLIALVVIMGVFVW